MLCEHFQFQLAKIYVHKFVNRSRSVAVVPRKSVGASATWATSLSTNLLSSSTSPTTTTRRFLDPVRWELLVSRFRDLRQNVPLFQNLQPKTIKEQMDGLQLNNSTKLVESLVALLRFKDTSLKGPRWWTNSQSGHLLLWQSEFESRLCLHLFLRKIVWKERK